MDEKIIKLMEKSERKLKAAQKLYDDEMYEDAISRGYYAMFHTAQMISRDKDLRESGDYEPFYIASIDEARCVIEDAKEFIKKVKEILKI
jgi:uncharacterized protein (UPF0332 family)